MSELSAGKPAVERWLEASLFHSRWLMAPFYLGLVVALAVLLVVFFNEAVHEFQHALSMTPEGAILMVLSLIDLSLAGNLLLIVIFSMKLIASIVAISAIALLKAFMELAEGKPLDQPALLWLVVIHLTFVVSGVLLALMDWLAARTTKH